MILSNTCIQCHVTITLAFSLGVSSCSGVSKMTSRRSPGASQHPWPRGIVRRPAAGSGHVRLVEVYRFIESGLQGLGFQDFGVTSSGLGWSKNVTILKTLNSSFHYP